MSPFYSPNCDNISHLYTFCTQIPRVIYIILPHATPFNQSANMVHQKSFQDFRSSDYCQFNHEKVHWKCQNGICYHHINRKIRYSRGNHWFTENSACCRHINRKIRTQRKPLQDDVTHYTITFRIASNAELKGESTSNSRSENHHKARPTKFRTCLFVWQKSQNLSSTSKILPRIFQHCNFWPR